MNFRMQDKDLYFSRLKVAGPHTPFSAKVWKYILDPHYQGSNFMCKLSVQESNVLKLTNNTCEVTPAMYPCLEFIEITGLIYWIDKYKHTHARTHTPGKASRSSSWSLRETPNGVFYVNTAFLTSVCAVLILPVRPSHVSHARQVELWIASGFAVFSAGMSNIYTNTFHWPTQINVCF
jgi:hypothetical protein